jgi:hypothetical protein
LEAVILRSLATTAKASLAVLPVAMTSSTRL